MSALANFRWSDVIDFTDYGALIALLRNSLIVGALLGLVGMFVMMRDLSFAVHGISELSFAGASLALLLGVNVVVAPLPDPWSQR